MQHCHLCLAIGTDEVPQFKRIGIKKDRENTIEWVPWTPRPHLMRGLGKVLSGRPCIPRKKGVWGKLSGGPCLPRGRPFSHDEFLAKLKFVENFEKIKKYFQGDGKSCLADPVSPERDPSPMPPSPDEFLAKLKFVEILKEKKILRG